MVTASRQRATVCRFVIFLLPILALLAAAGWDILASQPPVTFDPKRPMPAPPGDVRNIESLTTPPPGFTMQRRNNFYKKDDSTKSLYRWASSGHWSNYDEAQAGDYKLPDPLILANGQPVKDAKTWFAERRPEIVKLYETEIFGRVPANAPKVTWEITSNVNDGTTITKTIVGRIGAGGAAAKGTKSPTITITLTLPAKAGGRVPVIFGGSNKQQVLAKGWGYGTVNYGSVQQDSANLATLQGGVVGMTLTPGQPRPPDEWGVLRAWAWALSRVMDYL
jgi:hypothetical protein